MRKEEKLALVKTIANNNDNNNNNNNNNDCMSLRKALAYSCCSKNTYYYNKNNKEKDHGNHITAATAASLSSKIIEQEIQQISMERTTYGTRRMAAMLYNKNSWKTNQQKEGVENLQKDGLHYTIYIKVREIIRSKVPNVKADR